MIMSFSFAQNTTKNDIPSDYRFSPEFTNKLKNAHININDLETKSEISRYELARILNLVECWDCLKPGGRMLERYTLPYWDNFLKLPGKDFRDIDFKGGLFKDKSYYYCVAYVGDEEYMKGYPIKTSPICAGNFCGEKPVTKAEFIQVIINILKKYIYKKYNANRTKIYKRASKLEPNTYPYRTLTNEDRKTINKASNNCKNNTICPLSSKYEFETYLKYCMFNIKECGFKPFGRIKESYWPISELNIMKKEGLIPLNDNPENDIHNPIDGDYVLKVIGELHKKINCSFVLDYDCDDIKNRDDNCPNEYNPHQYDFDGDGKGNVCDDDIDNGGMKNPLGIVDDNNIIITNKRNPNLEGNLFDPSDDNGMYNKSIEKNNGTQENIISIDIKSYLINKNLYRFEANVEGIYKDIIWDFGDGSSGTGEIIEHKFNKDGNYLITAITKYKESSAIANATIIINDTKKKAGLNLSFDINNFKLPLSLNIKSNKINIKGNNYIQKRYINGQEKTSKKDFFQTIIKKEGIYNITSTINENNGEVLAVTQGTIDTTFFGQKAIYVTTKQIEGIVGQEITFNTKYFGFNINDVSSIYWDFGNGFVENNELNTKHIFLTPGTKVILQKLLLKDGTQYTTNLTIYIKNKENNNNLNNDINLFINKKIQNIGKEFNFNLSIKNFNKNNIKKMIFDFGDGIKKNISIKDFTNDKLILKHNYTIIGQINPKFIIYGKECNNLFSQATIYIKGNQKLCLKGKKEGNLMKLFHCDMDKDGIPDICDNDIDGDGKTNQMGLILFENPDCSLKLGGNILKQGTSLLPKKTKQNTNYIIKNNISYKILNELNVCSLDPCPFISNIINTGNNNFYNEDLNNNGICDLCEGLSINNDDIINNNNDIINNNNNCYKGPNINLGKIIPTNCHQCPCQFADFGGDLQPKDTVRAILMDTGGLFEYTWSYPYKIIEE